MISTQSQPSMGDYLVREGFITQAQFNRALEQQRQSSRSLGRILVEMNLISESMRMNVLQKRFGFELVQLKDQKIDMDVLLRIPYGFAEKHRAVPVRMDGGDTLVVAMEDPSDILVVDAIKNQVGIAIKACVATLEDIQHVMDQYATGAEQITQQRQAHRREHSVKERLWYKALKNGAFPVLAFLPLALFLGFAYKDTFGVGTWLATMFQSELLNTWDLCLYIALIWGLWAVILFEVNGLIFGTKHAEDEEE